MSKSEQNRQKLQYLDHILKNLPHSPGVYKMKNEQGEVIYLGKAKDLKNRVASYFQSARDLGMRTIKMVQQISDIEYIEVESELEALILETNLIKQLRPKYNVLMKDDKNYVYIKITVDEPFPRIFLVRKVVKDRARYFGPKTAAHKVIKTLKVLKRIFPFRHCQLSIDYLMPLAEGRHEVKVTKANIKFPCLDYHIKRCIGPCIGKVSPQEYRKIIDQVIRFLEGRHEEITAKLQEEMMQAAQAKQFEKAAAIRDKLKAVEEITQTQRVSDPGLTDLDVVNYVARDGRYFFNLFQLRNGKLIGQENFTMMRKVPTSKDGSEPKTQGEKVEAEQVGTDEEARDILSSFLEQYYEKATDLPKEVLLPHEIYDPEVVEKWLSEMKNQKVGLVIPERGKKNNLLDLSLQNAQSYAYQSEIKWQGGEKGSREQALKSLQRILKLPAAPIRLECYDISHFSGTETVGSMVVFENGFPKKSDYRHFRLHREHAGAPDDFASMEEVLTRRLKYLKPALRAGEIKVVKAGKKELQGIAKKLQLGRKKKSVRQSEWLPSNSVSERQRANYANEPLTFFLTVTEQKNKIGFVEILQLLGRLPDKLFASPKTSAKIFIQKIMLEKPLDLQMLVKKIAEKTRVKRLYLAVPKNELVKFEEFGCQIVKKVPEGYRLKSAQVLLVYDRVKLKEDLSFRKFPQLLIIDGGRGQLSSAGKALKKYDLHLPMISLAKREEEIFVPAAPGRNGTKVKQFPPILLAKDDPVLHMIQHIRDEAHRFAITYHQNLRLKATTHSVLDTIWGIGPKYRTALLQKFGSVENIKNAGEQELAKVVGQKMARKLRIVN